MDNQCLDILQTNLPSDLFLRGVSLEEIGISNYAWKMQDALLALEILREKRIPILGGDVYQIENGIKTTIDGWHTNRKNSVQPNAYLVESHKKTVDYIVAYASKNGGNYCYSLVIDKIPIGEDGASQ